MLIAVDFDGTIVKPTCFPCLNYSLLQNCKQVIEKLTKKGVEFELYTARYGWYRIPAIWFVKRNKLPIKTKLLNKKPNADLYIDDRSIFCKEINWLQIEKEIERILKEKTKCIK